MNPTPSSPHANGAPDDWSRIVTEAARDYAILTVDSAGRIVRWSPGAEAVFGWTAEEAAGQPTAIFFTAEDRAAGQPAKELETARANGIAPDVRWHLRRDGTRLFLDGATRLLVDEDGTERGFLKIGQDVTARRLAEEALRDSEARFRAVADLVPDLLWQTDGTGAASWYNQRWLEYTGQSAEEALRFGWVSALHPEDREPALGAYRDATASETPLRREHRIRRADGEHRWFLVQARPERGEDGAVARWFGAATDVHEHRMALEQAHAAREEAETARAALEEAHGELERRVARRTAELSDEIARRVRVEAARDELLRVLASAEEEERLRLSRELHDQMGQLITALLLGLRALEADAGPRADAVRDLERLAEELAAEIHDVAVALRPPALDRLGLARTLRAHLEEWAERHDVACDFHTVGMDDERFSAEVETALLRAVQEGLTNVAKHAGARSVSLVLERRREGVAVILEDDGRGFDVDAVAGSDTAGGRLGLLGMRERVRLLGGTLQIESDGSTGTTLFVRIPTGSAAAEVPG